MRHIKLFGQDLPPEDDDFEIKPKRTSKFTVEIEAMDEESIRHILDNKGIKYKIVDNSGVQKISPSDLGRSKKSSGEQKFNMGNISMLKTQLKEAFKKDSSEVKKLVESGKIDPNFENNFLVLLSLSHGDNDFLRWILPQTIVPTNDPNIIARWISLCYERGDSESAKILLEFYDITNDGIDFVTRWLKHSLKYKGDLDKDIDQMKSFVEK